MLEKSAERGWLASRQQTVQHVAEESCALFHEHSCLIAAENVGAKLVLDLVLDITPVVIVKVDAPGKPLEEVIDARGLVYD